MVGTGVPLYFLEFSWIMLQYSVQDLRNNYDRALCDKKWAIAVVSYFYRQLPLKRYRAPKSDSKIHI